MAAAVIGDTNGNGFTDVAIRASAASSSRMAVFTGPVVGMLDLATAPESSGFGPLLTAAGDLDADGLADFMFQYSYTTSQGVRFGYQLHPSGNVQPWSIRAGALTSDEVSTAVASDLDADGYGDFTTSHSAGVCDQPDRGTVSIGYGAKPSNTYILGLGGRTVSGANLGDRLGERLATGDLNGDGIEDIVATMPGLDTADGIDDGGAFILYGLPRTDNQFPNVLPTDEQCETETADNLGDRNVGYQFCLRTSEPIVAEQGEWMYDIAATVLVAGDVANDAEWPHPGTLQYDQCTLPIVVATLIGDDGITYELRADVSPTTDTALSVGQRVRIGLAGQSSTETTSPTLWANQAISDLEGLIIGYHQGTPNWCRNPLSFYLWDMQDVCAITTGSYTSFQQRVNGSTLKSGAVSRIQTSSGPMMFREYHNYTNTNRVPGTERFKQFSVARDRTEPSAR
jgi:hypothetical protein